MENGKREREKIRQKESLHHNASEFIIKKIGEEPSVICQSFDDVIWTTSRHRWTEKNMAIKLFWKYKMPVFIFPLHILYPHTRTEQTHTISPKREKWVVGGFGWYSSIFLPFIQFLSHLYLPSPPSLHLPHLSSPSAGLLQQHSTTSSYLSSKHQVCCRQPKIIIMPASQNMINIFVRNLSFPNHLILLYSFAFNLLFIFFPSPQRPNFSPLRADDKKENSNKNGWRWCVTLFFYSFLPVKH